MSDTLTAAQVVAAKAPQSVRPKPKFQLPTDRVTYSRQMDILRAFATTYNHSQVAVTNEQVAEIVEMVSSTVSLCNPFFVTLGFLTRESSGAFVPSQAVAEYGRASEWQDEQAAKKLAPLLSKAWFGTALLPRVRFRQVPLAEALVHLSGLCGVDKTYETHLNILIDYLVGCELLRRDGNILTNSAPYEMPAQPLPSHGDKPAVKQANEPPPSLLAASRVIPIPLGIGRLVRVELPETWNRKDLPRLLKMLEIALGDDSNGEGSTTV